jgi:hypothetical protein
MKEFGGVYQYNNVKWSYLEIERILGEAQPEPKHKKLLILPPSMTFISTSFDL